MTVDGKQLKDTSVTQAKLAAGAGKLLVVRLPADLLDYPLTSDWAINAAASGAADSNNSAINVRLFDDTTEEGVGFTLEVPSWATSMTLRAKSRAETAPGSTQTVALSLRERELADNAAVTAWSSAMDLASDVSIPTNENWQHDTWTDTLSNWGLTAGSTHQFELTRDTADAGDTLTGDWVLALLVVEFS